MIYSIGKFSELTGFSIDTLRYYEKQEIIIPKRDHNNRRIYDEKDVEWLAFIRKLKLTGMKLKDIQTYSKLRYEGDKTVQPRLNLLLAQSELLYQQKVEIEQHISFLNQKITVYQKMLTEQNKTE
ncbi:MerR family transcriptional regulator [Candidatus Enterococcus ferrettii]|uniref:HTH merR-type domain-containing protein n=1 Tax=Candidatus Enterococcus ferrettii TaxID=2815324 RepID=A0ABV0ERX7_9ENTE|nr:MerR family transcriptional regulator [Enterococcus sp. 665A]